MITRNDAESVILYMADIVAENRYLRARVAELEKENEKNLGRLHECYKANEEHTALLLHAALTQPVERALAFEKIIKSTKTTDNLS